MCVCARAWKESTWRMRSAAYCYSCNDFLQFFVHHFLCSFYSLCAWSCIRYAVCDKTIMPPHTHTHCGVHSGIGSNNRNDHSIRRLTTNANKKNETRRKRASQTLWRGWVRGNAQRRQNDLYNFSPRHNKRRACTHSPTMERAVKCFSHLPGLIRTHCTSSLCGCRLWHSEAIQPNSRFISSVCVCVCVSEWVGVREFVFMFGVCCYCFANNTNSFLGKHTTLFPP